MEKSYTIKLDDITSSRSQILNPKPYILPPEFPEPVLKNPKNKKKIKYPKLVKETSFYKIYSTRSFSERDKKISFEKKTIKIFSKSLMEALQYKEMVKHELYTSEILSRSDFIINLIGVFEIDLESDGFIIFVYEGISGSFDGGMEWFWSRVRETTNSSKKNF